MESKRTRIVQAIANRMEERFGPDGQVGNYFRKVRRGQWRPGSATRPMCTIVDDGKRTEIQEDTAGSDLALDIKLILDLNENWDREEAFEDWSDRVEQIVTALANWLPINAVRTIRYVGDDPFEVVFQGGKSEQIWIVEFEVNYFDDYGDLGKA